MMVCTDASAMYTDDTCPDETATAAATERPVVLVLSHDPAVAEAPATRAWRHRRRPPIGCSGQWRAGVGCRAEGVSRKSQTEEKQNPRETSVLV